VVLTVALDRAEDARPLIEEAGATHPAWIDEDHVLAEALHITNVPTLIWIDEQGRIVRPHDSQFGTDTFTAIHHKRSGPYLDMIRAWVREGEGVLPPDQVRANQPAPSADHQLARAERTLAAHLAARGESEAAERHFERAGELAPLDWTIRRGSMPLRGQNPFGPEFFALAEKGKFDYALEAITPTHAPETD
jgi:hypothetical protein